MNIRIRLLLSTLILLQSHFAECCFAQQTNPLQHFWEVAPDFGDIWLRKLPERMIQFDVQSLDSTQIQERVRVARMLCVEYKNPNFKQRELALELLIARLKKTDEPIQSRRAMISAATLLDQGASASTLWELAQADALSRATVEKALIRWKSPIAVEAWRKRLTDPLAGSAEVAIAIEGIATVGGKEDIEPLRALLKRNDTTETNRLLISVALGQLDREGLNELAEQVLESDIDQRHLLAANMLAQHMSEKTNAQLRDIFKNGSVVAQYAAARTLVTNFPKVAREHASEMVDHSDSTLRMLALSLLDKLTDEDSLRLQAKLLNDRNVEIRRLAGSQLIRQATEGQRGLVDEFITEHINAEPWQGIEQTIIMLVSLQDRARCPRLVELLEHARPEVNMHAGWALMELVQDSAILASIEPHVAKATAFLEENGVRPPLYKTDTIRLGFLFEAFGRNKYEPVQPLLLKYVPKNNYKLGLPSRASAIWALGQLNKGKDNKSLRQSLFERIADLSPFMPEDELVRFASILAVGEMEFEDGLPTLKKFNEGIPTPIGHACEWAIERIVKANAK